MKPLNTNLIANSYKEIFNIADNEAFALAKFTKGYAFAYQLLGYLLWFNDKKKIDDDIIAQFDNMVSEKAYRKIWSGLPNREKQILSCSNDNLIRNQTVMTKLKMKKNALSEYKIRLMRKGIIKIEERGTISIALPRFKEFISSILDDNS
jgi:hypothetical protein